MRFEEAYGGWKRGKLTQEEAARILGVCDRRSDRGGLPPRGPGEGSPRKGHTGCWRTRRIPTESRLKQPPAGPLANPSRSVGNRERKETGPGCPYPFHGDNSPCEKRGGREGERRSPVDRQFAGSACSSSDRWVNVVGSQRGPREIGCADGRPADKRRTPNVASPDSLFSESHAEVARAQYHSSGNPA